MTMGDRNRTRSGRGYSRDNWTQFHSRLAQLPDKMGGKSRQAKVAKLTELLRARDEVDTTPDNCMVEKPTKRTQTSTNKPAKSTNGSINMTRNSVESHTEMNEDCLSDLELSVSQVFTQDVSVLDQNTRYVDGTTNSEIPPHKQSEHKATGITTSSGTESLQEIHGSSNINENKTVHTHATNETNDNMIDDGEDERLPHHTNDNDGDRSPWMDINDEEVEEEITVWNYDELGRVNEAEYKTGERGYGERQKIKETLHEEKTREQVRIKKECVSEAAMDMVVESDTDSEASMNEAEPNSSSSEQDSLFDSDEDSTTSTQATSDRINNSIVSKRKSNRLEDSFHSKRLHTTNEANYQEHNLLLWL